MRFEFSTASNIIFGPGTVNEVPDLVAPLGNHVFVLSDSHERVEMLLIRLSDKKIKTTVGSVDREPDIDVIGKAMRMYKDSGCDQIICFGGGSTLDTGKVVAALATNSGDLFDYLEVVGKGHPLHSPSAPCIAIPTTSGTGSEVTRNAVISIPAKRIKVSLRHHFILPRISVIDPELTYTLPPAITASTGMDALTQLVEPFVSGASSPLTDSLCRDGIFRVARSLRKVFSNGRDSASREDMSLASLFGGMALANARLGAVHGLAGPIGGMYSAPHGAVCARLLPFVMEANQHALQTRESGSPALARYTEIARILTGDPHAQMEAGFLWVLDLIKSLSIPPLAHYGMIPGEFSEICKQARGASSMKGNPITLTDVEIMGILEKAY